MEGHVGHPHVVLGVHRDHVRQEEQALNFRSSNLIYNFFSQHFKQINYIVQSIFSFAHRNSSYVDRRLRNKTL
jgi:hypothetical protein